MGNKTGNIFNIQKFCIHDGPGIRTTVFFKGCPLRCKWCSNPESQRQARHVMIEQSRCWHCGSCMATCLNHAISISDSGNIYILEEKCKGCGMCVQECTLHHGKALSIHGEQKTVEEVMQELIKDKIFYDTSDGGVTFSGGEVLLQIDFAEELAYQLHSEKIGISCETTGYADSETFLRLLSFADVVLFDVKHYDDEKHFDGTGVHIGKIQKNLKLAVASGRKLIVRVPVIPFFNDSTKDAEAFGNLFKTLGIQEVNLLPFHQFGQGKYEKLTRYYYYHDVPSLKKEDLEEYKNIVSRYVDKVKIGG